MCYNTKDVQGSWIVAFALRFYRCTRQKLVDFWGSLNETWNALSS